MEPLCKIARYDMIENRINLIASLCLAPYT